MSLTSLAAEKTATPALTATLLPMVPTPWGKTSRVGRLDVDIVHVDIELVGANLGKHGLVTLTLTRGSGLYEHLSVRLNPNHGAFIGAHARILDAARDADTEISPLGACLRLPVLKITVTGECQSLVEASFIIATVIGYGGPVAEFLATRIRKLVGLHIVPAPDLGLVDPELPGYPRHYPFHRVGRVGSAGTTDRGVGSRVREYHLHGDIEGRDRIGSGEWCKRCHRQQQSVRNIGAVIVNYRPPDAEQPTLVVDSGFETSTPDRAGYWS